MDANKLSIACMPTHIKFVLSLLQDLVSKNEALRHQLHQLQVHTEQQLKKKDAAAQAEEERRSRLYQKAMDEAKQRIAEHVVRFNPGFVPVFEDVHSLHQKRH